MKTTAFYVIHSKNWWFCLWHAMCWLPKTVSPTINQGALSSRPAVLINHSLIIPIKRMRHWDTCVTDNNFALFSMICECRFLSVIFNPSLGWPTSRSRKQSKTKSSTSKLKFYSFWYFIMPQVHRNIFLHFCFIVFIGADSWSLFVFILFYIVVPALCMSLNACVQRQASTCSTDDHY